MGEKGDSDQSKPGGGEWRTERKGEEEETYIHVSSKDHDGPRIEFLRNNNLGVFSTIVLSNPNLRSFNLDQFGGNSLEGRS